MWPFITRGLSWLFRGSDSSVREHFDAVAQANRIDFTAVVAEWKSIAAGQKEELHQQALRITALEALEDICVLKQVSLERRIAHLELLCEKAGIAS